MQQLANTYHPIHKVRVLRKLAILVLFDEELERTVHALTEIEIELHKILPLINEEFEEIAEGNKNYIEPELRKSYTKLIRQLAILERMILKTISEYFGKPVHDSQGQKRQ